MPFLKMRQAQNHTEKRLVAESGIRPVLARRRGGKREGSSERAERTEGRIDSHAARE